MTWMASENLSSFKLKHFRVETLEVQSQVLKKTAWKENPFRYNPVLIPKGKAPETGWPVIWWLSGFGGNGSKSFAFKGFEQSFPQELEAWVERGKAPEAVVVFVDAWTSWGGCQFINSKGHGAFEDYLMGELLPALHEYLPLDVRHEKWCVAGGSSGGYGALHLASKYPKTFPWAAALAPDSAFEYSLLPEILTALPVLKSLGGIQGVRQLLLDGRLLKRKDAFTLLNAVAMGLCYSPSKTGKEVNWPVDGNTGILQDKIWKTWKAKDPLVFLQERRSNLKKIKRVFLDVGNQDQFYLQYGSRQIRNLLKKHQVKLDYSEFDGNHFDISGRKEKIFFWLNKHW